MKGPVTPFELNLFAVASNRHAIWEVLVRQDVGGFVAQDWKLFAPSFKFEGVRDGLVPRQALPKTAMAPKL
ncbi:hypothetical protein [Rhizobium sp.]|uniref:hypothetical protein n=1 Tax=Rhizobium sp. TaxID=391 RepID=UPI00389A9D79